MKANQFTAIFNSIHTRTGKNAPFRVAVLMMNGQVFAGIAQPATSAGLVQMAVERRALAHLTKAPEIVWLDLEAIQAVTDNEITAVPLAVSQVDSRKDGTPETQEDMEAHDDQSKIQSL